MYEENQETTTGFADEEITIDTLPGFDDEDDGMEMETGGEDAAGDTEGEESAEQAAQQPGGPAKEKTGEAPAAGAEPTYEIKFNGQVQAVPVSELVALAQKGMNHDRLQERLQAVEQDPAMRVLDEYAAAAGMTRAEYVGYLSQARMAGEVQNLVEQGLPEQTAREIVTLRNSEAELRQREAMRQNSEQQAAAEGQKRQQFVEFVQAYPEVKALPPEVSAMVAQGVPPLYAYRLHVAETQKVQQAAAQAAAKNRVTAPGSAGGGNGDKIDSFMSGFNSRD